MGWAGYPVVPAGGVASLLELSAAVRQIRKPTCRFAPDGNDFDRWFALGGQAGSVLCKSTVGAARREPADRQSGPSVRGRARPPVAKACDGQRWQSIAAGAKSAFSTGVLCASALIGPRARSSVPPGSATPTRARARLNHDKRCPTDQEKPPMPMTMGHGYQATQGADALIRLRDGSTLRTCVYRTSEHFSSFGGDKAAATHGMSTDSNFDWQQAVANAATQFDGPLPADYRFRDDSGLPHDHDLRIETQMTQDRAKFANHAPADAVDSALVVFKVAGDVRKKVGPLPCKATYQLDHHSAPLRLSMDASLVAVRLQPRFDGAGDESLISVLFWWKNATEIRYRDEEWVPIVGERLADEDNDVMVIV